MALILNGTLGLSDVDGSAATPAIRGTDTNTGIFFPAADTIAFAEGGVESARLDSSGNLGLGVTPSAWNSVLRAIQFGVSGSVDSGTSSLSTRLNNNAFVNAAGNFIYTNTGVAQSYQQDPSGNHIWRTAPSGTAGNAISFNQPMTLDASGGLLVGTTSNAEGARLNVQGGYVFLKESGGGDVYLRSAFGGSNPAIQVVSNSPLLFLTNNTERARIDSSGRLLVGKTSAGDYVTGVEFQPAGAVLSYRSSGVAGIFGRTDNGETVRFTNNSNVVGSISTTGSATAYNTSSDYRLKNAIAPMTGALAKVAALKPCTYKWKVDGSDGEGFIAHELAEIVPDAVVGEKDAVDAEGKPVYQGIDTSFLVATLTAALQEAHGLIKDLQARVDALEAK
jgi:hypothetical protein